MAQGVKRETVKARLMLQGPRHVVVPCEVLDKRDEGGVLVRSLLEAVRFEGRLPVLTEEQSVQNSTMVGILTEGESSRDEKGEAARKADRAGARQKFHDGATERDAEAALAGAQKRYAEQAALLNDATELYAAADTAYQANQDDTTKASLDEAKSLLDACQADTDKALEELIAAGGTKPEA